MKYLVTGGSGFIGSHLVDALFVDGHVVRILDNLSTGILTYKPPGVEFIHGDITEPEIVAEAMDGMDGCFHLAAVASVERGNLDWVGSHRTNITGTVTIFDTARKAASPIPVVYASSAAVYGENPDTLSEDATPRPVSAYGADKLGCELHGFVASRVHGVPNCGLRFFNVYGPRQDPRSPYSGVITIFSNRLKEGRDITINGDGYHTRDFIYVGDVVNALRAAMKYCSANGNMSDVFNVCTGVETNIMDLAEEIAVSLRERPVIHYGPPRPGDPRRSIGCPDKAHRLLGFRALTTLMSGLERTLREKVSRNTVWQADRAGAPRCSTAPAPQSSIARV
jgi:UDP-glucose 4-epimerase